MERNVVYYSCCESFDHCLCLFLFYYESIYCLFLFRISCVNPLQTNKKHCSLSQLHSTRRRGPLSRCDLPSHTSSPASLLWFQLFSTFSLHGILLPVGKALLLGYDNCNWYFKIYSMQTNMMTMITKLPQFSTWSCRASWSLASPSWASTCPRIPARRWPWGWYSWWG